MIKRNLFIGLEDGFAHYSPLIPKSYSKEYRAFITKVELPYIDSVYVSSGIHDANTGLRVSIQE